jgi:hypothetical protein
MTAFEALSQGDRDVIRALEEIAVKQPSPAKPGQYSHPFHVRRNCELAAKRLRTLLTVDPEPEEAPASPDELDLRDSDDPPRHEHWRAQMMTPFGRVCNALDRLLLAMGHFVSVFGVDVEGHDEAAGWVVSHIDGGRFLITCRPLADEEMKAIILGDMMGSDD